MLFQNKSPIALYSWFSTVFLLGSMGMFLFVFVYQSIPGLAHSKLSFITGDVWYYRSELFGAGAMILGTLLVAWVGLLIAVPIGIGAAIFTSEILPAQLRILVKITIELLAGIPSVIYGLLGVLFLRNWVYKLLTPFDPLSGDTVLTAGLLLGIMILPTIMTMADDALRNVPAAQRLAARGLGLNRAETICLIVLPQARAGIMAAILLAFGRAVGETIAVFLVIGRQDNRWPESLFSLRPLFEAGQTMTSKLGGSEVNIAYGDTLHWGAMMSLGLVLLIIVGLVTHLSARLIKCGAVHA